MRKFILLISLCLMCLFISYLGQSFINQKDYIDIIPNIKNRILGSDEKCLTCHESLINKGFMHPALEDVCENCHQSTGEKHPLNKIKGFSLTDKVPALCYMCHEEKNTKKYIHYPVQEGECTICHSPHSAANKFLLNDSITSNLCFECHDLVIGKNDLKHKPVKDGNCQYCHDPHQSDFSLMKKSKIPDLCVGCHEKVKQQLTSKRIHPPFEEECLLCHNPHSSKEKHLLVQTPPDLCFNCHDDFRISKKKSLLIHKPVEDERSCLNCHSPHASSEYRFLLKKEKQLCLSCHNKSIKTESRVIKNINQLLKSSKIIHGAIEGDGCVVCHSPHASTNPFLLVDVFPDGAYTNGKPENFSLCFNCHDSQMLTKEITTTATGFRKGDKNLHFVHINREKGRVCINCHNVHASKNEHLIATKVKFGNWEMPLKYIVNENGGSCSPGCHEKREYER